MSTRQIDVSEVPAHDFIRTRLAAMDAGLSIGAAAHDFDSGAYIIVITGCGREGRATFSRELLDGMGAARPAVFFALGTVTAWPRLRRLGDPGTFPGA
jgi:hypothetical protein